MSTSEPKPDGWEACPPGTLTRTVRTLQTQGRDRRRARVVGLTGGLAVLALVSVMIVQQMGVGGGTVPTMGKITCATVQSLLPAYVVGKLEAAVMGRIESHLDACPHCRDQYKKAKDGTALPGQRISDAPQVAMRS